MQKQMLVLIVMIVFSVSFFCFGEAVCEEKEIRGYFMTGKTNLDLDGLNTRFQNKGLSEISDELFLIGGGVFHKVSPRFMAGVEGQLLIGNQKSSIIDGKEYSSSILGGYGLVNTAYLVYESDRLDIFPIFGVGVGGLGVKIGQSSFDSILDNPTRAASLTSLNFIVNIGLETDFKMKVTGKNNNEGFVYVGLRGGYMFSPIKGGWYADEMSLTGDPEGGITGPYICLTIGGGGKNIKEIF